MWDYLIKGVRTVDPLNHLDDEADIAIENGKVAEVGKDLSASNAQKVVSLPGMVAQPGIIDTHLHLGINALGFRMEALAGVTTCLDMAGETDFILDKSREHGCGINFAILQALLPGKNLSSNDPDEAEINQVIDKILASGAYGVKILGGHFPLTPAACDRVLRICDKRGVYVAWHAGCTTEGSNIRGMKQAVEIAGDRFLHLAHINAYCRGAVKSVEEETLEAINLLKTHPSIVSESYLSARNGTKLNYDANDVPLSGVTRNCLKRFGYTIDTQGIKDAISKGYLSVIVEENGLSVLADKKRSAELFEEMKGDVSASFDFVNPFLPRAWLASAKRDNGQFVVDALSTDGGCIPRNVIIESGVSLIRLGALSATEFAVKSSTNPAKMLNLPTKGHLSVGADADITVYDPVAQKAVATFVAGTPVMLSGNVIEKEGTVIAHPASEKFLNENQHRHICVEADINALKRWHS